MEQPNFLEVNGAHQHASVLLAAPATIEKLFWRPFVILLLQNY